MAKSISVVEKQIEEAVNFTESKILKPDQAPSLISAKVLADQAAAMMLQDMRVSLQANEQIISAGIGKAIALSVNSQDPAVQKGGLEALEAFQKLLMTLPKFAEEIESIAHSILTKFGDPKADYQNRRKVSSSPKSK